VDPDSGSGFRIRIPDPDSGSGFRNRIPDPDPGLKDLKFKQIYSWKFNLYFLEQKLASNSVADPDPGSVIGCLFDHCIRDPG